MPEPTGKPINLYSEKYEGRQFTEDTLRRYLNGLERFLDSTVDSFVANDIIIVDYTIILSDSMKAGHVFLAGGFDLSVREAHTFSLPDFKDRYRRELSGFVSSVSYPCTLDGNIVISGWKSKKSRKIKGFFPRKD